VGYWLGSRKLTGAENQPFDPDIEQAPDYVGHVDLVVLSFVLVQNGTIQFTCDVSQGQECLCTGPEHGGWTQEQIKAWIIRTQKQFPRVEFALSIGGEKFNDWASLTSAEDFADNVVEHLTQYWTVQDEAGHLQYLIQGIDVDYETFELGENNSCTPLPKHVTFFELMKQLALKLREVIPEPIVSLPFFYASPADVKEVLLTPDSEEGLQSYLTFVGIMNYASISQTMSLCQQLKSLGYRDVCGFDSSRNPKAVADIVDTGNSMKRDQINSGMYWQLAKMGTSQGQPVPPFMYIEALNASLPKEQRIFGYWDGAKKITDPDKHPLDPDHPIPPYTRHLDFLVLGSLMVKNGTVQDTGSGDETCLCMGPERGGWTQAQIKEWLIEIRSLHPNLRFILSLGEERFSDWASIHNPVLFTKNFFNYLRQNWTIQQNNKSVYLIDGININYCFPKSRDLDPQASTPLLPEIGLDDLVEQFAVMAEGDMGEYAPVSLSYDRSSPPALKRILNLGKDSKPAPCYLPITFVLVKDPGEMQETIAVCRELKIRDLEPITGFAQQQTPLEIATTINIANAVEPYFLTKSIYWDLCALGGEDKMLSPAVYVNTLDAKLPRP
jgi:hypothetical protein